MRKPDYCPEWFDLKNYDYCKNLTREEWQQEINIRKDAFYIFESNAIDIELIRIEDAETGADLNFSSLYKKIINNKNKRLVICERPNIKICSASINQIFSELFIGNAMDEFPDELLNNWLDVMKKKEISRLDKLRERDVILDKSNLVFVDISKSDEQLKEEFAEWLTKTRNNASRFSDSKIQSIIKYKVLPYIDLYILKEARLTHAQMADLLFPPDEDNAGVDRVSTIRKTTAPLAMDILRSKAQQFL